MLDSSMRHIVNYSHILLLTQPKHDDFKNLSQKLAPYGIKRSKKEELIIYS